MKLVNVRTFRAHFPEYDEPVLVIRYSAVIGTWIPHTMEEEGKEEKGKRKKVRRAAD